MWATAKMMVVSQSISAAVVVPRLGLCWRGVRVFATDSSPSAETLIRERIGSVDESRLTITIGDFKDVALPAADLVYAQMSLPFAGSGLEKATDNALSAVKTGGVFAGHFFGVNDDWIDGVNTAAVHRDWISQKVPRMDRSDDP